MSRYGDDERCTTDVRGRGRCPNKGLIPLGRYSLLCQRHAVERAKRIIGNEELWALQVLRDAGELR